ncbi:MAG TPA: tail fiber domain-containing protein [Verrucomicrobiae bacterium]
MKKYLHVLACILVPMALLGQTVPSLVNYQGQLLDSAGTPLPTGEYTLTMSLYDAATSGALKWGPQVFDGQGLPGHGAKVPVVNGYFNLILGPADTNGLPVANAFDGHPRYLEIRVGSNPPIAPRQQILSAPFALNADKLGGTNWNAVFDGGNPATGKISGGKIADGSVTSVQILDGTIASSDLANGSVRSNHIGAGAVYASHISSLSKLTKDGSVTTALSVNSSGEVGLGTWSPGTITGTLRINGSRTDPASIVTPSFAVFGSSAGSLVLQSGRNMTSDPEAADPSIVFTATGDGYDPYTVSLQLVPFQSRLSLIGGALGISGSLYVTNTYTILPGTTYPIVWDSDTKRLIRTSSSQRYKYHIQPLQEDAYNVLKIEPKRYTRGEGSKRWEVGYIAEDLDQAGLKSVTIYDEQGRPDSIDYAKIVLYSNEIIKDQQKRLNAQQTQLETLKNELDELKRLVSGLKQDRQ